MGTEEHAKPRYLFNVKILTAGIFSDGSSKRTIGAVRATYIPVGCFQSIGPILSIDRLLGHVLPEIYLGRFGTPLLFH